MKKMLILLFLIFASLVNAQSVEIIREVPDSIKAQEVLNVKISLNNPYDSKKSYEIIETIPQGFELIDPKEPDHIEQRDAISAKIYKWKIEVEPKKVFVFSYKIKPEQAGEYTLSSTKVTDLSTNEIFRSEPLEIVVSCSPNNLCENNENSINCPLDCTSSSEDGICNYKADGICDLDCDEEPDCTNNKPSYNYYFVFAVVIFIIIFIIFRLFNSNKGNADQNQTL